MTKYKHGDVVKIKYGIGRPKNRPNQIVNGRVTPIGRVVSVPDYSSKQHYYIEGPEFLLPATQTELSVPNDSEMMQYLLEELA